RSAPTRSRTVPPSATRMQQRPGTVAYQTAPSASTQMPSGANSSSAQVRRFVRLPSAAASYAESRLRYDSATISVAPSSVIAMPLGNHTSPATSRVEPSGRTTCTVPGAGSSPPMKSKPISLTNVLPRASTTISFQPRPVPPYGVPSPSTTPAGLVSTARPSGSQSIENGRPLMVSSRRRSPVASDESTSPDTPGDTHTLAYL